MSKGILKVGIPALLIALSVYAVIYFRATEHDKDQLVIDAAKSALDFIIVTLVGGAIAVLVRTSEERRKVWLARRDLLRTDLSNRLWTQYGKSKQVRRLLRASKNQQEDSIDYVRYSELLENLSDIQIEIEGIKRASRIGVKHGIPETIHGYLDKMEKYLGNLVTEYENTPAQVVMIEKQPRLREFIAEKKVDATFWKEYVEQYRNASSAVEKAIEADLGQ